MKKTDLSPPANTFSVQDGKRRCKPAPSGLFSESAGTVKSCPCVRSFFLFPGFPRRLYVLQGAKGKLKTERYTGEEADEEPEDDEDAELRASAKLEALVVLLKQISRDDKSLVFSSFVKCVYVDTSWLLTDHNHASEQVSKHRRTSIGPRGNRLCFVSWKDVRDEEERKYLKGEIILKSFSK